MDELETLRNAYRDLSARHLALLTSARKLRDDWLRGDEKCWKDLEILFSALPEGYAPPERDTYVELENCRRYLASCHDPRVVYVSPQNRIEELEDQVRRLKAALGERDGPCSTTPGSS